jgi:hypothetical protein
MDYVYRLSVDGDPTEKLGVAKYDLGEKFPRYAEFWGSYVVTNRDSDQNNKHKLRDDFPIPIEEIFNTHYSIFYQLVFTYAQIEHLAAVQFSEIVDVGSPFYHLATAADLIDKLFVAVYSLKTPDLIKPLTETDYDQEASKFWNEDYKRFFDDFTNVYRSVTHNFHDARRVFCDVVPESKARTKFNRVQGIIRQYRNKFIHGVSPLRLWNGKEICFPKITHLKKHASEHWSSKSSAIDAEHYEPAVSLMTRLADELVDAINDLWELLINEIKPHVPMPETTTNTLD